MMKTATVRDLRNHFADVAKWIDHGEEVSITRNGAVFATLSPARVTAPATVDWKARFMQRKPVGKGMTAAATQRLWSEVRDS